MRVIMPILTLFVSLMACSKNEHRSDNDETACAKCEMTSSKTYDQSGQLSAETISYYHSGRLDSTVTVSHTGLQMRKVRYPHYVSPNERWLYNIENGDTLYRYHEILDANNYVVKVYIYGYNNVFENSIDYTYQCP